MKTHLDQTADEVMHRLGGDSAAAIKRITTRSWSTSLRMADTLSDGIEKQLPGKFSGMGKLPAKHPAS